MTEDKAPYTAGEAANDQLDWETEVRDGEVWLIRAGDLLNLGSIEAVFGKWADFMAAEDFEEG